MQTKLSTSEKLGYSLGDAAANLVWRGALAFLAVFYTDTFGLETMAVAALLLIVRLSDGVTDIIVGMIADRTESRWGKFRPWVLFSAPVLGIFMVLTFTTPDLSPTAKLVYAYVTYIGLTLAYTMNNVPYSALMGVMTPSNKERTILSSWRFAAAFMGGFLVMVGTPVLVDYLGGGNEQLGYQYTMYVFAVLLVILLIITFYTTKERVQPPQDDTLSETNWGSFALNMLLASIPLVSMTVFFYYRNIPTGIIFALVLLITYYFVSKLINKPQDQTSSAEKDIIDLLTNKPWLILLCIGFLFMMFNGIKIGAAAYYFRHYVSDDISITQLISWWPTDLINIQGKEAFLSVYFAAFMPILFFAMLGDCADYSEWKNNRRATGLVFSAGTFINKTGGGFAGALIVIVLGAYGYVGTDESTIHMALPALKSLMSWIPAIFALVAAILFMAYPLSEDKMNQIEGEMKVRRGL